MVDNNQKTWPIDPVKEKFANFLLENALMHPNALENIQNTDPNSNVNILLMKNGSFENATQESVNKLLAEPDPTQKVKVVTVTGAQLREAMIHMQAAVAYHGPANAAEKEKILSYFKESNAFKELPNKSTKESENISRVMDQAFEIDRGSMFGHMADATLLARLVKMLNEKAQATSNKSAPQSAPAKTNPPTQPINIKSPDGKSSMLVIPDSLRAALAQSGMIHSDPQAPKTRIPEKAREPESPLDKTGSKSRYT